MEGPYLRIKELAAYLGIAVTTIYDITNPKSPRYDETFPKKRRFGQRSVAWSKPEVDEWSRMPKSRLRLPPTPNGGWQKKPSVKASGARMSSSTVEVKQTVSLAQPLHAEWNELLKAQQRDSYLLELLGQNWTPVMAALLANGIEAPLGCIKIPDAPKFLGDPVNKGIRLIKTSSILRNWTSYIEDLDESSGVPPSSNPFSISESPYYFLKWFEEEEIDTPWLRLIKRLAGFPAIDDPQSFKLLTISTPVMIDGGESQSNLAHCSIHTNPQQPRGAVTERASSEIGPPPGKLPRTYACRQAIKAAWEIENQKGGQRATVNEVMDKLTDWCGGQSSSLIRAEQKESYRDRRIVWVTSSGVEKKFDVENCKKALKIWDASRCSGDD